ncbi:MAG: hypothetical protein P1U56_13320 [Saprospiraceae bacterium]|nr:hypothetical protein [Saprospiraceae bacterium]
MNKPHTSKIKFKKVQLGKADELDLVCDACGSDILGEDININSSLAKCNNCQRVFSIKEDHFFNEERVGRPEMIMPEGTDVLQLSNSLDIRLDWLKSYARGTLGFLTFFTVLWNGILAMFGAGALLSGSFTSLGFMSIHILVGLGLIYFLAMVYLNYTDIIVTSSHITISHRPIKSPFQKSKQIDVRDIDQLYVSKYVSSTTNGKPNYAYALYAILKTNSRKIKLVKGMNLETQLYLEQEIERFLKIEDRAVSGSIKG